MQLDRLDMVKTHFFVPTPQPIEKLACMDIYCKSSNSTNT